MSFNCQALLSSEFKSSTQPIRHLLQRLLCVLLVGICLYTNADKEDVQEPLIISADDVRGTLDGGAEASGNVELRQGPMELDADRLVLQTENGKFDSFEATGSPIRFKFQVGEGSEAQTLNGAATMLVYRLDDNLIEFRGNAEIQSDEISIVGDIIRFDLQSNQFEAKSTSPNKQVEITILDIGSSEEAKND